jgi:FtsK/SpoIIIE family
VVASPIRPVVQPVTKPTAAARQRPGHAVPAPQEGAGWFQFAILAVAVGAVAAGFASLAGQSEWPRPMLGLGVSVATLALGAGARTRSRGRQAAAAAERLAPLVGLDGASRDRMRRLIHARWPLGARRQDPPRRVTVCPPVSCSLADPAVLDQISYAAGRIFTVQMSVRAVHRRRHEIVLAPARLEHAEAPPEVPPPTPREVRCAEVVLGQRLGANAEIVDTTISTHGRGTSRLDSLDIAFTPTTDNTEPGFWTEFEAAFNRQVPGRWQTMPDLVADPVTTKAHCRIQRRPTLPTRIPYDLDLLDQCGEYDIPYAIDDYGRTVVWSLKLSPHMLVSGATRSGKSSTLRAIVRGFIGRGWPALVCDPKRTGLLGMRDWPGVQALATPTNTPAMVAIIDHVHAEMDRRYAAVEAGLTRKQQLEPLLLVLDEYRELQEEIRLWWARDGASTAGMRRSSEPPAFDLVGAIARLGGAVGVHLVIGIKRPDLDVKVLPAELTSNCRSRCSHGALTRDESHAMWGSADVGRSVPPMIQGRATAVRSDGVPGEVQALWMPDPLGLDDDDVQLYRGIQPTSSPHPWLKPIGTSLAETSLKPESPWGEPAGRHRAEASDAVWEPLDVEVHEWDAGYGPEQEVAARKVAEADLVELVEGSNVWVVVDHITTDPDEPDMLYIDGRVVDTGHPKTIVAAEESPIRRRQQFGL